MNSALREAMNEKLHPPIAVPGDPDENREQEDLAEQPATLELINSLGFDPDKEWPDDDDEETPVEAEG